MELVCTRSCLDKYDKPYIIGGLYKYYDSQYVFDTFGNKIYDIFEEEEEKLQKKSLEALEKFNQEIELEVKKVEEDLSRQHNDFSDLVIQRILDSSSRVDQKETIS